MSKPIKERPILFSGPMVRALLDGSKTQTRRVVKCPHEILSIGTAADWNNGRADPRMRKFEDWGQGFHLFNYINGTFAMPCPHGKPGDQLWVRETFGICTAKHTQRWPAGTIAYRADHGLTHGGLEYDLMKWKPSIFMPRIASRITLEIISVRVERLQDISEQNAKAEGAESMLCPGYPYRHIGEVYTHLMGFKTLWESINGSGSWDLNPWLWVIEFKRIFPGEDTQDITQPITEGAQ